MSVHLDRPDVVTGGCGFVGRHLISRLLEAGRDIIVVDDLSTGRHPDEWLPDLARAGSLRDGGAVVYDGASTVVFFHLDARQMFHGWEGRLDGSGVRVGRLGDAFHFAAVVGGRLKIDGDPLAVARDLALDAEFFNWALAARPARVLYASSSAAYPINLQGTDGKARRLVESDIGFESVLGMPDMTYGWSKLTGEYLARIAAKHYGLHVACIRPFSGYGEDQDMTYPIPAIARRAARREDPLTVWGSGLQGRDFVHIDDCISASLRAIECIGDGSAVNIASGVLTTFLEVAALYARIAGYEPRIVAQQDKPAGVHQRCGDPELARVLLGWQPSISLEAGLTRVYRAAVARDRDTVPVP